MYLKKILYKYRFGIIFILLGSLLRGLFLFVEPLFLDESFSWVIAQNSYQDIWGATAQDTHPPLYYVLLKAWMWACGDSLIAMRLLSFGLWIVTAVGMIIIVQRFIQGNEKKLLSYSILACLPIFLVLSVYARMYALVIVFLVFSFIFFEKYIRTGSRKALSIFSILILLALYTDNIALFTWVGFNGFILIHILKKLIQKGKSNSGGIFTLIFDKQIISWVFAQIVIVVCYIPWLLVLFSQSNTRQLGWIEPLNLFSFMKLSTFLFGVNYFDTSIVTFILGILLTPIMLLVLWKTIQKYLWQKEVDVFPAILASNVIFSVIMIILLSLKQSIWMSRTFLIVTITFVLLFCWCLIDRVRKLYLYLAVFLPILFIVGTGVVYTMFYQNVVNSQGMETFLSPMVENTRVPLVVTAQVTVYPYPYSHIQYFTRGTNKVVKLDKSSDTGDYIIYNKEDFIELQSIKSDFYYFTFTTGDYIHCPEIPTHTIIQRSQLHEVMYKSEICLYEVR